MKKPNDVTEKQYQRLNKLFKPDEKEEPVTIKREEPSITYESKLMCGSKYSFINFSDIIKYYALYFTSKYNKLLSFCHQLIEFRNLTPRTEKTKMKKKSFFKNAANQYNTLLAITDEVKKEMDKKYNHSNYFLRFINMMNSTKKMKKKVDHSWKRKFC